MKVRSLIVLAAAAATTGCAVPFMSRSDAVQTGPTSPPPAVVLADAEPITPPAPSGPSAADEPVLAPAPRAIDTDDFRIGPEDILDIQVWKNNELSRVVPVRPDGKISLPLVNDIQAAGLTATELRDQVTKRLAEFVPSPEVSVMVREVHSPKAAVVGNVRMPGHYEMKSPATVLELLARAQGLTEFADRGRIVVLRQTATGTTRIPFNYSKVASSEQENFYVRPGDVIVVP